MASEKFEYTAIVHLDHGVEEVQFAPVNPDAPRIPSRYESDPEKQGRFTNGRIYKRNPEKDEAEFEEVQAQVRQEQVAAQVKAAKEQTKTAKIKK